MGELENRLDAVLSDPEQMSRIAQMASRLMGSIAPDTEAEAPAAPPGLDPAMLAMLGRLSGKLGGKSGKEQLLRGLAPYLSAGRSARLEKALRLAAAAGLAGAALEEMGGERP